MASIIISMSSSSPTTTNPPQFQTLFFNPSRYKSSRITMSTMDSSPMNCYWKKKKKKEAANSLSQQLSSPAAAPLIHHRVVVETSRFCDLRFDRLQPSDDELDQQPRLEFGQFVAREALLDEEYWTAAWLRAENLWEFPTSESEKRRVAQFKRRFTEQEFHAIKRRCQAQNGESYACIIAVRKEQQKNAKSTIIKSVVGTLDLSVRYMPAFCRLDRTPPHRYGYIGNLCVAKSARRQGIATNMLHFAVESAKSYGVERIFVHVEKNNKPAQALYQNLGFQMIGKDSLLLHDHKYLLAVLQLDE